MFIKVDEELITRAIINHGKIFPKVSNYAVEEITKNITAYLNNMDEKILTYGKVFYIVNNFMYLLDDYSCYLSCMKELERSNKIKLISIPSTNYILIIEKFNIKKYLSK